MVRKFPQPKPVMSGWKKAVQKKEGNYEKAMRKTLKSKTTYKRAESGILKTALIKNVAKIHWIMNRLEKIDRKMYREAKTQMVGLRVYLR